MSESAGDSPLESRWAPAWAEAACVVTALCLGGWLRFARLGDASLWTDEFVTVITAQRPFVESLLQLEDQSAPLYQCLLRPWMSARPSEWFLRFPAALFGWLIIPMTWLLARSLFGPLVACTSALWIACNPWMVYHSREARGYTLFAFFATASMFFFHRLLVESRVWALIGYILSTSLVVYSHYFGFAILGAQGLLCIVDSVWRRPQRRGAFTLWGLMIAAVSSLPALWMLTRVARIGLQAIGGWVPSVGLSGIVSLMGELLNLDVLGGLLLLPIVGAFWPKTTPLDDRDVNWFDASHRPAAWLVRRERLICALWIVLGLWSFVVVSALYKPVVVLRYVLPLAVPITLLGLATVRRIGDVWCWAATAWALLVYLPACTVQQIPRPGMREAVAWLEKNAKRPMAVYVLDWSFCEGFIHPEVYGAEFYGYPGPPMRPIPLGPNNLPKDLPRDKNVYVISFQPFDHLTDQLVEVGRRFRARNYYLFRLYEMDLSPQ